MMSQAPFVRPPRIALWLVDLFTPSEQAESIPGDLLEEFLELALKSGDAFARRWYWRQSVKTVAHLIATGFLVVPWLIAGTAVGGLLLCWVFGWSTQKAVVAVLYRYQVYAHIDAHVFWLIYAVLIQRLIEPLIIGCIIAVAAKGKEMVATLALGLILGVLGMVAFLAWSAKHGYAFLPLPLVATFGISIMIIMGGGIVQKTRSAMSRRHLSA